MFDVDIARLVPKFIMNDRNGRAIAKAIEAGMKYMLARMEGGLNVLMDVSQMPEWRLDELAWELGCLYDYNAAIENKRKWLSNALPYYSILGTPASIINYLEGLFDEVIVRSGSAYHFTVSVSGIPDSQQRAWIRYAVEYAKNVRSVFDGVNMMTDVPNIVLTDVSGSVYITPIRFCGMTTTGVEEL